PGRDEHVGAILGGKYKLIEAIGEGGMGSVFMALQTEPVKRAVAVKVIKAGMDSKAVLARFEAERQALAMMDHPNIARVLDAGTTESGRPFFVMELVKGVPITEFCDARRLTPNERLELFVPVCQAIQHAHMKGIIHRDIKPSNVLIALYDDKPVPKVIDFGVAKATGPTLTDKTLMTGFGAVVGTPEYMSPEQASLNQLDVDTRSDVYSLGVLLYELLTGTTPVDRKSLGKAALLEILRVVREVEAPRPSVKLSTSDALPSLSANRGTEPRKLTGLLRNELDWIVMKALEKDRTRRYESANGFAADVQRYLSGEAVQAVPPSLGYRFRKWVRKHKAPIASGIVVCLALLVGVAATIWQVAQRRHEQLLAKLQSFQTATAAMDRAEVALVANRLSEIDVSLELVDAKLFRDDPCDFTPRIETIRKDRDTLSELETIYEEYWTVCPSNTYRDPERAKMRYPDLFQRYGIPVGELTASTAVDRIKASLIAPALTDGLATWFFLDPKVEGLRPLLDRLDPDEFRVSVRAAVAAENKERLKELATKVDPSQHPPIFSVMLAGTVSDPENYRILKAAWRRHPDSFAVVLALAFPEPGVNEERAKERDGWNRMAIALRPNNALVYYYFGLETEYTGDTVEGSLRTFQRAVELAPRFASAHVKLGDQFHRMKRDDEALTCYLRATELDPSNIPGQAKLASMYLIRKD
ncbi:MAG: protein kinase domain-containing protein, partial [Gemmataceae bacterium]